MSEVCLWVYNFGREEWELKYIGAISNVICRENAWHTLPSRTCTAVLPMKFKPEYLPV